MTPSTSVRAMLVAVAVMCAASAAAHADTYRVDSLADAVDANPGDGACRATGGGCTLRAAMMEAERHPTARPTVMVPAGHFRLTRPPAILPVDLTMSQNGDLDILSAITIVGAGARRTVIDGNQLDRIFTVVSPLAEATISDLTITGGVARERELVAITGGGGVANQGSLTLRRVSVRGNSADYGGGIFNTPTARATIEDSTISDNTANIEAGGIRFDAAGTVVNSTITGNRVLRSCCGPGNWDGSTAGEGGGIDARGAGRVVLINSTIVGNHATSGGGAVNIAMSYQGGLGPVQGVGGPLQLRNTILAGNTTDTGPANCKRTIAEIESLGHNIDDDGSCGLTGAGDLPATDPSLGPFGDHGGETDTFSLLAGSPAIDQATDCSGADQRGTLRSGPCDMGAFEFTPTPGCIHTGVVTLRLRVPRGARIRSVKATIDGRRIRARRTGARRVALDLSGRPAGGHRIRLTVGYSRHGKKLTRRQTRLLRTCT